MRRRAWWVCAVVVVAVMAVIQTAGCEYSKTKNKRYQVVKVFDGDTIKLSNGEKVRLIGIDCPESYENDKLRRDAKKKGQSIRSIMAQGRKAGAFTKKLADGKKVFLEFDEEKRDRYGRLLAYVWVELPSYTADRQQEMPEEYDIKVRENEWGYAAEYLFLNSTIVRAGYAEVMTISPNTRYAYLFKDFYREARGEKRGLWK